MTWSLPPSPDVVTYLERFPKLKVKNSVLYVHDGKYITSAGGAMSFEAVLYVGAFLYDKNISIFLAKILVIDENLSSTPHFIP
jgi:transcriptional regulator GlxA family with amidase domain